MNLKLIFYQNLLCFLVVVTRRLVVYFFYFLNFFPFISLPAGDVTNFKFTHLICISSVKKNKYVYSSWLLNTLPAHSDCFCFTCFFRIHGFFSSFFSSVGGGAVGNSGYSNLTPFSHSKIGQQSGNGAVLLVFSDNLHFGLAFGSGPQSSTWKNIFIID